MTKKKEKFTHDERKMIKQMIDEGHTYVNIANAMGKTYGSIKNEINHQGNRESYDPDFGNNQSMSIRSKRLINLENNIQLIIEKLTNIEEILCK